MGLGGFVSSFLGGTKESSFDNPPQATVWGQFNDIWNSMIKYPALMQGFQLSSALGQDPFAYLSQFKTNATGGPNVIGMGTMADGKLGMKLDLGKLAQANAALTEQYETKQLEHYNDFVNKLGQVPAFADVVAKSKGQNLLSPGMTAAFQDLAGSALGSGASGGFISDPLKQQNVLGPVAMQKAMAEYGIQQDAQKQLWALSGAGGLVGASQMSTLAPGVSPYSQGILAGAGLFGTANMQSLFNAGAMNTQASNQFAQFNSSLLPPLLSGGSGEGQALGGLFAAIGSCWVAEELYGVHDVRTHAARLYASTHDSPFLSQYRRYGRGWAAWLKSHPWAKPLVAPIWDEMARRGFLMVGAH